MKKFLILGLATLLASAVVNAQTDTTKRRDTTIKRDTTVRRDSTQALAKLTTSQVNKLVHLNAATADKFKREED